MKYVHTNIISEDWRALAHFYTEVFDCQLVPPERNQSGKWLDTCTGVVNAQIKGVHLRLPGYGEEGPTLEIYSYSEMKEKLLPLANRKGYGHIAFEVADVASTLQQVLKYGGKSVGEISGKSVKGVGYITVVYAQDPEGNILELQNWNRNYEENS